MEGLSGAGAIGPLTPALALQTLGRWREARMTQPDVLPVGRFTPSPGLFVDRREKSVVIGGFMELSGAEATPARALSIQRTINLIWTQTFSDGYSVRCNVTVRYRRPGSSASNVTQIQAAKIPGPSHVTPGLFFSFDDAQRQRTRRLHMDGSA